MTIEEFSNKLKKEGKKTSKETIIKWLNNGYIRGAYKNDDDTWYIPSSAKPPYTKNGNPKTESAIYKSIVKGTNAGCDVFAELYKISEAIFDAYISELIKNDLLFFKEIDGIKYYFTTVKSKKYLDEENSKIWDSLKKIGGAVGSFISSLQTRE